MSYLELFHRNLAKTEMALSAKTVDFLAYMISSKEKVNEILKDATLAEPNEQMKQKAIAKFADWTGNPDSVTFGWMDLSLLCWGLDTPIQVSSGKSISILRSDHAFKKLEILIREYRHRGITTPYPWQGLFRAFLNFPYRTDQGGKENWNKLRRMLGESVAEVANQAGCVPRWLEGLLKHKEIFEENITAKLAKNALTGRMEEIFAIAQDVDVPATSWFWPELIMSQVEEISEYSDNMFKSAIETVLRQLAQRTECLDDGLAGILDRYAKCASTEPHVALKSEAVKRWRSPSLERQREWERVKPETKRMVQRWLVVEDLRDFFLNLRSAAGEEAFNRRRFEFWMQFLDQITYSHLILGPETRGSLRSLLSGKVGRYSDLTGTTRSNNAFVMRLGNIYIVEFSGVGKTWAYNESKMMPLLRYGSISYNDILDPDLSLFNGYWGHERGGLAHRGGWEGNFHAGLESLGIRPDSMNLDEFIDRYNLGLIRQPSGTEWVQHKYAEGMIAGHLHHSFKFEFHPGKGFFRTPRQVNRMK